MARVHTSTLRSLDKLERVMLMALEEADYYEEMARSAWVEREECPAWCPAQATLVKRSVELTLSIIRSVKGGSTLKPDALVPPGPARLKSEAEIQAAKARRARA